MARPATFDRADTVRAARAVFWTCGYEQAGLAELERATGLNRSSIYNTFGSKQGLFEAAVHSYLDEVVRPRLAPLSQPTAAASALEDFLTGLRDAILAPGAPAGDGCLLLNAAGSPISHDPVMKAAIADYRAELRRAIGHGVAAAAAGAGADETGELAEAVTAFVSSAMTLARVDPEAAGGSLDAAAALVRRASARASTA